MTPRPPRRPARTRSQRSGLPGLIKVRLIGDTPSADALTRILLDREDVELLTGPDRYDGGRQYLLVRITKGAGER